MEENPSFNNTTVIYGMSDHHHKQGESYIEGGGEDTDDD